MGKNREIIISLAIIIGIISVYAYFFIDMFPSDFNFVYTYGINGKENYNSYTHTLIYDSSDGLMEIELNLTRKEKKIIYEKIKSSDFMSSLVHYEKVNNLEPIEKYTLEVELKGNIHKITWSSHSFPIILGEKVSNEKLGEVVELGSLIELIINEHIEKMGLR